MTNGCSVAFDTPGALVPKTVIDDASLQRVAVNGVYLHYRVIDNSYNNKWLILLHGGPGFDYRALEILAEMLSPYYNILLYDQRGSGLSERLAKQHKSLSVAGHVEDIEALRMYFVQDNVSLTIIGHSWGGFLLQAYLAKYGEYVETAIFLSSLPPSSAKMNDNLSRNPSLFGKEFADFTWQRNFFSNASHEQMDFNYQNYAPIQKSYYFCNTKKDYRNVPYWRYGFVSLIKTMENGLLSGPVSNGVLTYSYDLQDANKRFMGQVYILYGTCDKALGKQTSQELFSSFANAIEKRISSVDQGGHYFWLTNINDTMKNLKEFLRIK